MSELLSMSRRIDLVAQEFIHRVTRLNDNEHTEACYRWLVERFGHSAFFYDDQTGFESGHRWLWYQNAYCFRFEHDAFEFKIAWG